MNTKPIASLGALLAAVTEMVGAAEQRITDRLGDLENRIVGLEDKITELGAQADEIKEEIIDQIHDLEQTVAQIDVDTATGEIRYDLDELVDAERRRERLSWLADVRKVS